ncbi:GNAT family N-acetyltransferase [Streptococcus moroccensis]|uniref:Diamine N-acetyltransferase n=1 Tax=Streptococcus moroccensis TaxID=1451356 RepID=A0ABT9YSD4_9STRE|nr:GNAT family N-acetyltransferase [Streptococcus moroccensis]MDQ0222914.1 diamine N-acetyltransferase [Streptococcus moroccensis]
MLRFEEVTEQNVWDILALNVSSNQMSFVASNAVSLTEAYLILSKGGHVFPFGLYDEAQLVGFIMLGYGKCWDSAPEIAESNYNLWRLMIDKRYQGNGYGKKAVELATEFVNTFPNGPAKYLWLSYEPENRLAQNLYAKCGFQETGEKDGEELIAVLNLS